MKTQYLVRVSQFVAPALLVSVLCLVSAPSSAEPLADVSAAADLVVFEPTIGYHQVRVTLSGPEGFEVVETFDADENVAVALPGADGLYKYELRFSPVHQQDSREQRAAARTGSDKATDEQTVQRGWFSVADGDVVPDFPEPQRKVVLTNANGVIRNALCVGFDCPDSPTFGDSSVLMMENNNRIKFGDTSNAPFPNNDWEIEANSSSSGGASYLGFNDCGTADNDGNCANDLVFAVEAGVRQSALYVESDGDVGLGTSNPVLDLHIVTGNTPAIRLDQDGSSGFAPQVWDIAGNETSFFIRDATNGSTLPFRIRPGAPSSALFVDVDGDVGLGTSSPSASLHVLRTNAAPTVFTEYAGGTTGSRDFVRLRNKGNVFFTVENSNIAGSGETWKIGNSFDDGSFVVNNVSNSVDMRIRPDQSVIFAGDVTANGMVLTSDRNLKAGITALDGERVLATLATLPISEWHFRKDGPSIRHVGPMAQDFYAAFGLGEDDRHIAPLDASGIALTAIQQLHQTMMSEMKVLQERLQTLEAQLDAKE